MYAPKLWQVRQRAVIALVALVALVADAPQCPGGLLSHLPSCNAQLYRVCLAGAVESSAVTNATEACIDCCAAASDRRAQRPPQNGTGSLVTAIVVQYATSVGAQHTTYRLAVQLKGAAQNVYSLMGSKVYPLIIPPAYQAKPLGKSIGGVNPTCVCLFQIYHVPLLDRVADGGHRVAVFRFYPNLRFDSWLTIGITDGDSSNQISSVGQDWAEWTDTKGLNSSNMALFWMQPTKSTATAEAGPVVVAQLTVRKNFVGAATISLQGRHMPPNSKVPHWRVDGLTFPLRPAVTTTTAAPSRLPSPAAGGPGRCVDRAKGCDRYFAAFGCKFTINNQSMHQLCPRLCDSACAGKEHGTTGPSPAPTTGTAAPQQQHGRRVCLDDLHWGTQRGDCATYGPRQRNDGYCVRDGADRHCLVSCGICRGGNPKCWAGGYTFRRCCSGVGGNSDCFNEHFTFDFCCSPPQRPSASGYTLSGNPATAAAVDGTSQTGPYLTIGCLSALLLAVGVAAGWSRCCRARRRKIAAASGVVEARVVVPSAAAVVSGQVVSELLLGGEDELSDSSAVAIAERVPVVTLARP
jgi:hypothetical protein